MKKIFVINGGQVFGHSGGRFNATIIWLTLAYFNNKEGYEVRTININEEYDPTKEVEKFTWADEWSIIPLFGGSSYRTASRNTLMKYLRPGINAVFTIVTEDLRRTMRSTMVPEACCMAKSTC